MIPFKHGENARSISIDDPAMSVGELQQYRRNNSLLSFVSIFFLVVGMCLPVLPIWSDHSQMGMTVQIICVVAYLLAVFGAARLIAGCRRTSDGFLTINAGSDQFDRYRTLISLPEGWIAPVVRAFMSSLVDSGRALPTVGEVRAMTMAQIRWETMRTHEDLVLANPYSLFEENVLKRLRVKLDKESSTK